jgi:hypothetical protein
VKRISASLFVVTTALILGCNATIGPLKDYNNIPVHRADGKTLSVSDMDRVIHAACAGRGWSCQTVEPGHIVRSVHDDDNKFGATVDFLFTGAEYSIHYKRSFGLRYDPAKHQIHKHYGFWIGLLEQDIASDEELINLGS